MVFGISSVFLGQAASTNLPANGNAQQKSAPVAPGNTTPPQGCQPIDPNTQVHSLQNNLDQLALLTMFLSVRYMVEIKLAKGTLEKNPRDEVNAASKLTTPKVKELVLAEEGSNGKVTINGLVETSNYYWNNVYKPLAELVTGKKISGDPTTSAGITNILKEAGQALNDPQITQILDTNDKEMEKSLSDRLDAMAKQQPPLPNNKLRIVKFMQLMNMLLSIGYMVEIKMAKSTLEKNPRDEVNAASKLTTPKVKERVLAEEGSNGKVTMNGLIETSNYYWNNVYKPSAKAILGVELTNNTPDNFPPQLTLQQMAAIRSSLPSRAIQDQIADPANGLSDKKYEETLTGQLKALRPESQLTQYTVSLADPQPVTIKQEGQGEISITGNNLDQVTVITSTIPGLATIPADAITRDAQNTSLKIKLSIPADTTPGTYALNLANSANQSLGCLAITVEAKTSSTPLPVTPAEVEDPDKDIAPWARKLNPRASLGFDYYHNGATDQSYLPLTLTLGVSPMIIGKNEKGPSRPTRIAYIESNKVEVNASARATGGVDVNGEYGHSPFYQVGGGVNGLYSVAPWFRPEGYANASYGNGMVPFINPLYYAGNSFFLAPGARANFPLGNFGLRVGYEYNRIAFSAEPANTASGTYEGRDERSKLTAGASYDYKGPKWYAPSVRIDGSWIFGGLHVGNGQQNEQATATVGGQTVFNYRGASDVQYNFTGWDGRVALPFNQMLPNILVPILFGGCVSHKPKDEDSSINCYTGVNIDFGPLLQRGLTSAFGGNSSVEVKQKVGMTPTNTF